MADFTVVIPSKSAENITACLTAIWKCEPKCHVVVVDDGIEWRDTEIKVRGFLKVVDGDQPFCYSRNINIGLKASPESGAWVLCNDDALLQTPGGFTAMLEGASQYGLVSATTNVSGSPEQRPQGIGLRPATAEWLAFVCVLIPRSTIEAVGYLDEEFIHYGWDDWDLCKRIRRAGLALGVHDGCYVDHSSLKSTYRGTSKLNPRKTNDALFKKKWSGK
jgi:hypothetical protein